jgi:hypothetical protein
LAARMCNCVHRVIVIIRCDGSIHNRHLGLADSRAHQAVTRECVYDDRSTADDYWSKAYDDRKYGLTTTGVRCNTTASMPHDYNRR